MPVRRSRISRPLEVPLWPRRKSSSGSLRTYLITRLLLVIPMVWILVTLVFFVLRVIGDPIEADVRRPARRRSRSPSKRHAAGLDKPLITQYWHYLTGVVARRLRHVADRPPTDQPHPDRQRRRDARARRSGPCSSRWLVGVPLGRVAARYRDRLPDVGLRLFGVLAYAIPVFFLGLLLKLLFAIKLGWFFASGRASPDVELAINNVSPNTHIYMINAIQYGNLHDIGRRAQAHRAAGGDARPAGRPASSCGWSGSTCCRPCASDYVEAARARGVPERRVVRKHAFRNALIPVVTVMGLQVAALLGGAVLTETTFEWQGLGYTPGVLPAARGLRRRARHRHRDRRDRRALISFLIDVIAAIVDPRVRY